MVKIYPKNIKIAIDALEHMIEWHTGILSEAYIKRARMAISNLEDYEQDQKEQKERKLLTK